MFLVIRLLLGVHAGQDFLGRIFEQAGSEAAVAGDFQIAAGGNPIALAILIATEVVGGAGVGGGDGGAGGCPGGVCVGGGWRGGRGSRFSARRNGGSWCCSRTLLRG